MEGMVKIICLQATSYRTITIHRSPDHTTDTLCLLQFQQINSTCVFSVVTIDVDYPDDDRDCHCDVQGLSCTIDHKGHHNLNEDTLCILEIHD